MYRMAHGARSSCSGEPNRESANTRSGNIQRPHSIDFCLNYQHKFTPSLAGMVDFNPVTESCEMSNFELTLGYCNVKI